MSVYRSKGRRTTGVLVGTPYSRSEADALQSFVDAYAAQIESILGPDAARLYACKYEGAIGRVRAGLQPRECTEGQIRREFQCYLPFLE